MYIPDRVLARQEMDFGERGTLLLFEYGDPKNRPEADPYRKALVEMAKEGEHRNVFLIDQIGNPVWRISDYEQTLPDCVVQLRRPPDKDDEAIAVTFHGNILAVRLDDGAARKIGWEK